MIENRYSCAFNKPFNIHSFIFIVFKIMFKYILYKLNFFFSGWNS